MSEPEAEEPSSEEAQRRIGEQSKYVNALVKLLVPAVQNAMNEVSPPESSRSACFAGFVQAFTELELSLAVACNLHPIELVRGLRLIADDLERDIISKMADVIADAKKAARDQDGAPSLKVDF